MSKLIVLWHVLACDSMPKHRSTLRQLLHCREAEERRQAIALEKQQAAEAREREVAAQRAQREAERQALRRLQRSFAVRVEGSVSIDKPPKVKQFDPLHKIYL